MASPPDRESVIPAASAPIAQTQDFDEEGSVAAETAADATSRVGQCVGQYRIVRQLGSGGMGVVYEARHESIGQRIAIKVLRAHLCHDPEFTQRFFTEARAATIAQHPGLVRIFDFGKLPDGTLYMLLELLEGESLSARLQRRGRLAVPEALVLLRQVVAAMAFVHSKGIFHRDLKPDNLFIVRDPEAARGERAKILDFGLARIKAGVPADHRQTSVSSLAGSPAYMAPEQCRGLSQADGPADVYALGISLYEMLAGRLPFEDELPGDLMLKHIQAEPPPLSQFVPEVLPELQDLVARMLTKDPTQRPLMATIATELSQLESRALLAGAPAGRSAGAHGARPTAPADARQRTLLISAGLLAAILVPSSTQLVRKLWRAHSAARVMELRTPMVPLRAGTFTMGSTTDETSAAYYWCQEHSPTPCRQDSFSREQPAHQVRVAAFNLDATEVTNQQFADWLNQNPRFTVDPYYKRQVFDGKVLLLDLFPMHGRAGLSHDGARFTALPGYERRPVTQVTWDAAAAYCQAQGKRLPSEAEWEYAARATQNYRFPWGFDEPQCEEVVIARSKGLPCAHLNAGPAPVAASARDRSPQGVYDLAGNVSEWVQDAFLAPYLPCAGSCENPIAAPPAAGAAAEMRVVRGGDWSSSAVLARAAMRSRVAHDRATGSVGFRCAQTREH